MRCEVHLPPHWVRSRDLDQALAAANSPLSSSPSCVFFTIPSQCKIMVDTAVRLLSLANQLSYHGSAVTMAFESGMDGTMGYLDRMGFFEHLAASVDVRSGRPGTSTILARRGLNTDLVEIVKISPGHAVRLLPTRLADALKFAVRERADSDSIGNTAFTIFGELIDNIFQHSATVLDGYASLQTYRAGGLVKVAVSDSGRGIMETLRPALCIEYPCLDRLSDAKLLLEMFKKGISRHGQSRGVGLKRSAAVALKHNAAIEVRLPTSRVALKPSGGKYTLSGPQSVENLPLIWGTHISFDFLIDW